MAFRGRHSSERGTPCCSRLSYSGSRTVDGTAYTQSFDYDNRLLGVAGGSVNATFLYDADSNRVKGTVAGVTTVYIAGLYE